MDFLIYKIIALMKILKLVIELVKLYSCNNKT